MKECEEKRKYDQKNKRIGVLKINSFLPIIADNKCLTLASK